MNRLAAACALGVFALFGAGCAVTGVGDPCIPESEFRPDFGQNVSDDLTIDVNSVQCETRVCLVHYFRGRVSCPYGNAASGQSGQCLAVKEVRGLYTLDGTRNGTLCCPVLGDVNQKPVAQRVEPQCSARKADQAVYCSCRCDVPDDPEIDRTQVSLCKCPTGFTCKPLCDRVNGNCSALPKGKWGSYCVRDSQSKFDPNRAEAACGADLKP